MTKLPVRGFDIVVIDAGGVGMCAVLRISQNGQICALLSKVFPTRSHTVSVRGGTTIALGDTREDNWEQHIYDAVKESDYIGDQDAIEYMCKTGPEAILRLEHMGLPFSRPDDGRIYQHPFGGQSRSFGGEQAARTAAAADRTDHALLHTLYQQNLKSHTTIFSERHTLDLVKNQGGAVVGCTALCIGTDEVVYFKAHATVPAAGGVGHIYQSTTNAHTNISDGVGIAICVDIPVQSTEMWQFHSTGIAGTGVLVIEGCRGKGGYLLNKYGECSMERYAPNAKDLTGRDVVTRSIMTEIREGHSCDGPWEPRTKLKLDHLGKEVLESRLPGTPELSRTFTHIDPVKEPIPVIPTCHHMMGGIPTKVTGQALTMNGKGGDVAVPKLLAIGEIVYVSVHGANRLDGNSPLGLVVFGRAAGLHLQEFIAEQDALRDTSESDVETSLDRLNRRNNNRNGEDPVAIRKALQGCMQHNFSASCEGDAMVKGLEQLKVIRGCLKNARLDGTPSEFNTQRAERLELDNPIETAYATAVSTNFRIESRGMYSRSDLLDRDDESQLCYSLYLPESESIAHQSVSMEPKLHPAFPLRIHTYQYGDRKMRLEFSIYRYNLDVGDAPCMQDYIPEAEEGRNMMLLGALVQLKKRGPNLSFHHSRHESVCGSDGLNMNSKSGPACITPISALNQPDEKIVIRPLSGLPTIRDLVVGIGQFHA